MTDLKKLEREELVYALIEAWGDIHEWTVHHTECRMLDGLAQDLPCSCGLMACYDKGHEAFAKLIGLGKLATGEHQ